MKSFVIFVLASTAVVSAQEGKEPRFSIGLGVLAPSYSQKFAGNGRLDVDQNKNGFSYSLNNVPHPSSGSSASYQSQSNPQQYQSAPGSDYSSQSGQFSIYQHRSIPKQSADTSYHSPSLASDDGDDGSYRPEPQQNSPQSHGSPPNYQMQSNLEHRQYDGPSSGGAPSYSGPQETYQSEPDYNSEGQNGANGQHNGPRFAAYNFEQEISHQMQEHQPFQSNSEPQYHSQGGQPSYQSYQPQQSHPQTYQSQPTHQRVIGLAQPIRSQSQHQYKPQAVYAFRV